METDKSRLEKEVSSLKEEHWKEQIKVEQTEMTLSKRDKELL